MKIIQNNTGEILDIFPVFDTEFVNYIDCKNIYEIYNISIHTHFLNNKEANKKVIFFNDKLSKRKFIKYQNIEDNYVKCFINIYNNYEIFFIENSVEPIYPDSKYKNIKILQFESIEEFINSLKYGLREQKDFYILIPDLKIIIRTDFDLEVILFSLKDNQLNISILNEIFKMEGFFLLKNK